MKYMKYCSLYKKTVLYIYNVQGTVTKSMQVLYNTLNGFVVLAKWIVFPLFMFVSSEHNLAIFIIHSTGSPVQSNADTKRNCAFSFFTLHQLRQSSRDWCYWCNKFYKENRFTLDCGYEWTWLVFWKRNRKVFIWEKWEKEDIWISMLTRAQTVNMRTERACTRAGNINK